MQTTQYIWQNGALVPWDEAKIHVLSHSLHYGGSAFEGIRFYHTENGPAIFRLADHINRLFYSISALKMVSPYTPDEISEAILELVRVNELPEGYIRPIFYYGHKKMGVNPIGNPVELAISCWPWGAYIPHGADVKTSKYIRVPANATIIDAKLSGNYLNGILASLEITGTHYNEVLFLNEKNYIAEGAGENFFLVKNNVIYTPKLGAILAGITRDTIIKLIHEMNYHYVERDITLEEAYTADEAFFTGTAAEVSAIRSIDDHILNKGEIGSVTAKIKAAYLAIVHGENPQFLDCLTFVKK